MSIDLLASPEDYMLLDMFTGIAPTTVGKIQPSIVEFMEHPSFCGKELYPRQRTLMKIIFMETENFSDYDEHVIGEWLEDSERAEKGVDFGVRIPLDLMDRIARNKKAGRTHFGNVIDIGGRRGGKGFIGGGSAAYLTHEMIRLDDPQRHFGVDPDKDLYINIVATSAIQARKFLFADAASMIMSCKALRPYIWKVQEEEVRLQTPANLRYIADLKRRGVKVAKDIASIRVMANSSSGQSGRGGAAFSQMFDEFAHLQEQESTRSASEVYDAYTPSLAQMGLSAFIYVPSSPATKTGKFYELSQAAFETDEDGQAVYPEMFAIQRASWHMYDDWQYDSRKRGPIIALDADLLQKKRMNPAKFKVEYEGKFAETVDAYLDPEMVDRMFAPFNGMTLKNESSGLYNRHYRFHCDPSRSQANTPIGGGHIEDGPDGYKHVVIDHIKVFQPHDFPPDPEVGVPWIDYTKVVGYIIDLSGMFNISVFSFDQWQNVYATQQIRAAIAQGLSVNKGMRVKEVTFTQSANWKRCEQFKTALYMGWVHAPVVLVDYPGMGYINLASEELKFLRDRNGRVEKQTEGPVQTKDVADCYDSKTEVLTENGWKLFKDVLDGERVMTLSPDGRAEYQSPVERIARHHKGKMLSFAGGVDFCVTPRHRMLVKASPRSPIRFQTADALPGQVFIPRTHEPVEGTKPDFPIHRESLTYAKTVSGLPWNGWTKEEDAALTEMYPAESMPRIISRLGRSRHAIYVRAKNLGLHRGQIGNRYSDLGDPLPECDMVDFARFIGFWLGDGRKVRKNHRGVRVTQSKPDTVIWFDDLIKRMKWAHKKHIQKKHGGRMDEHVWSFSSKELSDYLYGLQEGGLHLPNDAWSWDIETLGGLYEGLMLSDGCLVNETFWNTSRTLMDDFQRLIIHLGKSGNIKEKNGPRYLTGKFYGCTVRHSQNSIVKQDRCEWIDYDDMVYCLTVPNSTLMVRRNDKPMWCGNCLMQIVVDLLGDQISALTTDDIAKRHMVGAAKGSYMHDEPSRTFQQLRHAPVEANRPRGLQSPGELYHTKRRPLG